MMTQKQVLNQTALISTLSEIAQALSAAWDLDSTLELITHKTTEMMHMDSCSIYLLEPDQVTLRLRASTGLSQRALGRATLKVGEGMTGYAVAKHEPVYAADAHLDPHFKWVEKTGERQFHSLLAVPLLIGSQTNPLGAINVQTKKSHKFLTQEIELLQLIADLAAGALAKAQILDRQRQQIAEMHALARASEVMTSPQYLDDMLNIVSEMAARTMNASVCSIFLLNEPGTHLELRTVRRTGSPYQHRQPIPLGVGIVGQVHAGGKAIYIRDVRTDPNYVANELAAEEGLVSLLSVPLVVRDRTIGVLNCYTLTETDFTNEQRVLFMTLANQTALAIENARLLTNTAVLREMHHRIKNNLQTIAMLMELQIGEAENLTTLEVLEDNIHRVRSIATVHEVLSEKGFKLVDVKDVLQRISQSIIRSMISPNQKVDIQIIGESLMLPSRHATALTVVVNELIQNALEHGFAREKDGRIQISLGKSMAQIIVLVKDDGQGMPEQFESGLGLEIAHMLIREDLQGQLKFNPVSPQGTEVSIRLPRTVETLEIF